jgi:hypothetical protein
MNRKTLTRASMAGIGLAIFGIVLFGVLWVVLAQTGLQPLARLIAALCIPPAVIAGILGLYVLYARPNGKNNS